MSRCPNGSFPGASASPEIEVPPEFAIDGEGDRDVALHDLLRSRLGGLGPVTASEMAESLALDPAEVEAALIALQTQGSVLRGRFYPVVLLQPGGFEW